MRIPTSSGTKTGAPIVHVAIRRSTDGRTFQVTHSEPIAVRSSEPAELRRATQAIADALGETIAAAPEQWYSFKPIWPATPEEATDLERRATLMRSGIADPGPAPEFA